MVKDDMQKDLREIYKSFILIEDDYYKNSNGSLLWDMCRFPIYSQILKEKKILQETSPKFKIKSFQRFINIIYSLICFFIQLFKFSKLINRPLFIDSRRYTKHGNQLIDLYIQPFLNEVNNAIFARSENWPLTIRLTKNNLDFNLFNHIYILKRKLNRNKQIIDTQLQSHIERIAKYFDMKLDTVKYISKMQIYHHFWYSIYSSVLKALKPPWVILVCSYGKESLIKACQDLDITVAEIQHGLISTYHMGYSFPSLYKKRTIPDLFFSFGDYWKNVTVLPFEEKNIFCTGYPEINRSLIKFNNLKKKNQIVVISQPAIGNQLSRYVITMSNILVDKIDIVYKLHPKEYKIWRKLYPWLENLKIRIVSSEISIHKLLAESTHVIGVYSTAVFEALALNCAVTVFDLPGTEYMDDLVQKKIVRRITEPEEFDTEWNPSDYNSDVFFARDTASRIPEAIKLLNSRSVNMEYSG